MSDDFIKIPMERITISLTLPTVKIIQQYARSQTRGNVSAAIEECIKFTIKPKISEEKQYEM